MDVFDLEEQEELLGGSARWHKKQKYDGDDNYQYELPSDFEGEWG